MTYPGGKAGSGVYQALINMMPPHSIYVEAFLGAGAVMLAKKTAHINIGIDLDDDCLIALEGYRASGLQLVKADATQWLAANPLPPDALVYCDPPYLMETRKTKQARYKYEMTTRDHIDLLNVLIDLNCMVMISGYRSDLYLQHLQNWRVETFQATTRSGKSATEYVWLNFDPPFELHDYRYLGSDYRERERIKRKKTRWANRLRRQPPQERHALMAALEDLAAERRGEEIRGELPGQPRTEMTMPVEDLEGFRQAATVSYTDTKSILQESSSQMLFPDPLNAEI
jgi:hypothetical protein